MLNVVILAAGKGTRMQSDLPKVLHQIAGKSMLAHVVDSARALKPDAIIVVTGHGAEQVQAQFAEATDLQFVLQQPQLGTGHAVQQAVSKLVGGEQAADTTLILYGDVPLVQTATMQALIEARQDGMAVLTEFLTDPTGYGRIVRNEANHIVRIVEHKDATAQEHLINEVNTGIIAAPTAQLKNWLARLDNNNAQQEYYLTDIIGFSVADGVAVHAAHPTHAWETLGVNSRLQQAQLERAWQGELARRLMESGVTLADPARIDIRGQLQCGRDVFIDVGCVFEGQVVLGDGVHIGPHSVIKEAQLGAGTVVHAFSHIDQSQAAERVSIGPFARLRPGTQLGDQAHVGNFVEIKNSQFAQNAKASHLSYIGDATVGQRVNIGAGVITCNYDGANKFRTVIGDDAFIGSDSQLVAPVTIGKNTTVAAGTTVVRDTAENGLVLSPKQQVQKTTWQRPQKK